MAIGKDVENSAISQLEKARQAKIAAEQKYEELKKQSEAEVTGEIKALIASAGLEPMSLYDGCLSGMPISGDVALHMASKLISKSMMSDAQVLSVLKSHRVLTSVSSGEQGSGKGSRSMYFRYMLEAGESEAIASGKLQEGKHRHDPAFWCQRRKPGVKPDWYSAEGRYAEFVRTDEEYKKLLKYRASHPTAPKA